MMRSIKSACSDRSLKCIVCGADAVGIGHYMPVGKRVPIIYLTCAMHIPSTAAKAELIEAALSKRCEP